MDSFVSGARMSFLIIREGPRERPGPVSWGPAVPWGSWECFAVPGFLDRSDTRVSVKIFSGAGKVGRGKGSLTTSPRSLKDQESIWGNDVTEHSEIRKGSLLQGNWRKETGGMLILMFPGTHVPHFSAVILTLWLLKQNWGIYSPVKRAEAGHSGGPKEGKRPHPGGRFLFPGWELW